MLSHPPRENSQFCCLGIPGHGWLWHCQDSKSWSIISIRTLNVLLCHSRATAFFFFFLNPPAIHSQRNSDQNTNKLVISTTETLTRKKAITKDDWLNNVSMSLSTTQCPVICSFYLTYNLHIWPPTPTCMESKNNTLCKLLFGPAGSQSLYAHLLQVQAA